MSNETYYRQLSEMYAYKNEGELKPYKQLLLVKGVLYKMEDELTAYRLKTPNSTKLKESNDRLNILFDFVDEISSVLSENMQLRILLRDGMVERSKLEDMALSLQKQLEFASE
jgi:hypothetical protein